MKLAAALAALAFSASAHAAGLSADERDRAVKLFASTREKFLASVSGLSEAQWKWKPAPERWSIAEVAEHIALAEARIPGSLEPLFKGAPTPAAELAATRGKDQIIVEKVPLRLKKAQAPEMLKPSGAFRDRDHTIKAFEEARRRNVEFVQTTQLDLHAFAAPHPAPTLGMLDGYQWMLLIAAHSARHTAQIEEVKTAAGYPK
jgi:hypothetical protein